MEKNSNNEIPEEFLNTGLQMYEKKIEQNERKIYDLKTLINIGLSLSSNLNFISLVESILYSCIGQVFVDKVAILLQEDIDSEQFHVHMQKGYEDEEKIESIRLKQDSKLINYMGENCTACDYNLLSSIMGLEDDLAVLSILEPHIIIPMKSKDSLNGLIILGDKMTGEEFSEDEKEFLNDLAKFAAVAVENSRLYLMATLDRMTRLYIHHYFQERLIEEIRRSQRSGSPLCLIMSDIDHFKHFNDTYGHQQGDVVLKELAMIFKNLVRNIDIPARYGGEEFAVILPDTDLDSAVHIASRLRKHVEDYEFTGQDEPLSVTISIGVAQYNASTDEESSALIKKADIALYKAKNAGRNRVVAHK